MRLLGTLLRDRDREIGVLFASKPMRLSISRTGKKTTHLQVLVGERGPGGSCGLRHVLYRLGNVGWVVVLSTLSATFVRVMEKIEAAYRFSLVNFGDFEHLLVDFSESVHSGLELSVLCWQSILLGFTPAVPYEGSRFNVVAYSVMPSGPTFPSFSLSCQCFVLYT